MRAAAIVKLDNNALKAAIEKLDDSTIIGAIDSAIAHFRSAFSSYERHAIANWLKIIYHCISIASVRAKIKSLNERKHSDAGCRDHDDYYSFATNHIDEGGDHTDSYESHIDLSGL